MMAMRIKLGSLMPAAFRRLYTSISAAERGACSFRGGRVGGARCSKVLAAAKATAVATLHMYMAH